MNSRKLFFIGLCFYMAMMVFAGGSRQSTASPGAIPTLEIGMQQATNVSEYKDNYLTRVVEKMNNVNLEFYILPMATAECRTKIALMAASSDLPETLWTTSLTRELILDYGTNGIFIPLNKHFGDPSKTPYFNRLSNDVQTLLLNDTVSADGNNYSFIRYQPLTWNEMEYRLYINHEWLAKLGIETPKTTDQLREALIAFRDKDPNGNGRQDEIGVFGWYNGGYGENVIAALINSFVYWNPIRGLALDATGRTVTAPFTETGFRKALQYLNSLYQDKVLDATTFTTDQVSFRATINAQPMVVGLTSAGSSTHFVIGSANRDTNPAFIAMKPLVPPFSSSDCPGYTPYTPSAGEQIAFVTNKAKNQDLAVKVMDSFYEGELSIICRYGEKGVDWTDDPAYFANNRVTNARLELGLFSKPSIAILKNIWPGPVAQFWGNLNPRYVNLEFEETACNMDPPLDANSISSRQSGYHYMNYSGRYPEHILPQLTYTINDAMALAQPITNINDYVKQSIAEFTTGVRDINNDTAWNAYLREMDNMGLQQWLRASQVTFDRIR